MWTLNTSLWCQGLCARAGNRGPHGKHTAYTEHPSRPQKGCSVATKSGTGWRETKLESWLTSQGSGGETQHVCAEGRAQVSLRAQTHGEMWTCGLECHSRWTQALQQGQMGKQRGDSVSPQQNIFMPQSFALLVKIQVANGCRSGDSPEYLSWEASATDHLLKQLKRQSLLPRMTANLMIAGPVIWAQSESRWKANLYVATEI